ncbi:transient receptor potential cation channel trpm-like [Amphiura filiformis]|uniref:transient receptor potential cation channel trpm-like n=1 Tax=Amphiura filiformis TaxID=82378 RepID=UPI003B224BA1
MTKDNETQFKEFNEALKKAFKATSTWILSNGSNCGATKCVGDIVREGQVLRWDGVKPVDTVKCIGIAPWGYVEQSDNLIVKDNKIHHEVVYFHGRPVERKKPVPLNPNHTHFILVDDGRKTYGADLKLRPKLERAIVDIMKKERKKKPLARIWSLRSNANDSCYKNMTPTDKSSDVPFVLIVLEGGDDAINHVLESLNNNIAIVVCDKTGRAANILAHIHREVADE